MYEVWLFVLLVAFMSVIQERVVEVFSPFENNPLALVIITNWVYALCRPSRVEVDVDKYSSSVTVFFLNFFS